MTVIDSDLQLDQTLDREILPMALNETGQPRLVVFYNEQTWEVPLEDADQVSIGRSDDNTIPLTLGNVSRRHAEVVRKGGIFILRDLGSTNGTWLKEQKVGEVVLQDGDVFRVGQGAGRLQERLRRRSHDHGRRGAGAEGGAPPGGLRARLDGLRAVAGQRARVAQHQDALQEPGDPALPLRSAAGGAGHRGGGGDRPEFDQAGPVQPPGRLPGGRPGLPARRGLLRVRLRLAAGRAHLGEGAESLVREAALRAAR